MYTEYVTSVQSLRLLHTRYAKSFAVAPGSRLDYTTGAPRKAEIYCCAENLLHFL